MQATTETKGKKKGFFALLKDSIIKSNDGCGPGCGCHAADEKKKAKAGETAKVGK
jgi:hypothetical protein